MKRNILNIIINIFSNFMHLIKRKAISYSLREVGLNFQIGNNFVFTHPQNTIIGNNVFINSNFYCSTVETITIKDRVMFGANCSIIGGDHMYSKTESCMRFCHTLGLNNSIVIEEDAWIGHGAIILKNAYISEGAIIGAGSLVNSRTLPYSIYIGNPLKFLKPRFETMDQLEKHLEYMRITYNFKSVYSNQELLKIYEK